MATILVVDDLAVDRKLVRTFLEEDPSLDVRLAADGVEAMAAIDQAVPDAIVTDLMMPRMDGLELVAAVRQRHPLVPVILMTSRGSEDIAIEALRLGAASYVPKRRLAGDLLDTVRRVLAVSTRQRGRMRLLGCMVHSASSFVLGSDSTLFDPLIAYLQEAAGQLGLCGEADATRVGIALAEALSNALYHGNLEIGSRLRAEDPDGYWSFIQGRCREPPYCHRHVYVGVTLSRDRGEFVVRDEGPGFDPTTLPDPTDPANLERPSGRGLLLMRTFMDHVDFNAAGNAVTLVKCRRAEGK